MEIMDPGKEFVFSCMLTVIKPNRKLPGGNMSVSEEPRKTSLGRAPD